MMKEEENHKPIISGIELIVIYVFSDKFSISDSLLSFILFKPNLVTRNCLSFDSCVSASKMSNLVLPHFKPCVDEYLEAFSILNDYKFLMYDIKVKKIPMGGGFHSWHFETGGIENCHRVFVVQLYVNDDFEGGETEFLYQNRREEAIAGDVLIFPAGFTHTHRGNPPLGGHKYLITSWGHMQE